MNVNRRFLAMALAASLPAVKNPPVCAKPAKPSFTDRRKAEKARRK